MSLDNHYANRSSRIDALASPESRNFWNMIVRLSDQFEGEKNTVFGTPKDFVEFGRWCEENHGFQLVYDQDGGITTDVKITDPHRYTLCVLKYSS